jgi:malonyl CoA-acyl carrier protein transacylase
VRKNIAGKWDRRPADPSTLLTLVITATRATGRPLSLWLDVKAAMAVGHSVGVC